VKRLQHPAPVSEVIMMAVAALGLVVNGGIMLALRASSRNDLNVRSAFVHMLGDALGSIAIRHRRGGYPFHRLAADRSLAFDSDRAADRVDRMGHYPRVAQTFCWRACRAV